MSKAIITAIVGTLCCMSLVAGCVATKTTRATIESESGTVTLDRSVSLDTGTQAAE